MDARRMAYLDAMGIDVWVPRGVPAQQAVSEPVVGGEQAPASATAGVCLGPGQGEILCIAASAKQAHMKLATNISGAMRSAPVWAWPTQSIEESGGYATVAEAVGDRLITRVLVFGAELAASLLGEQAPETIGTAKLHVVPAMEALESDVEAKRALWALMRETSIAAPRPGGK